MCVSRCLRCVGVALVALAIICTVANILLLLPELKVHFLLEGHVTREASWATGLWSSGLLVRPQPSTVIFVMLVSCDLLMSCDVLTPLKYHLNFILLL